MSDEESGIKKLTIAATVVMAFAAVIILVVSLLTADHRACQDACIKHGFHHGWIRGNDCICLNEAEVIEVMGQGDTP